MRMLINTVSYVMLHAQHWLWGPQRRRLFVLGSMVAAAILAAYHWHRPASLPPSLPTHVDFGLPSAPQSAAADLLAAEHDGDRDQRDGTSVAAAPSGREDELVSPFTGATLKEEQRLHALRQRLEADQQRLEIMKTAVQIAEQRKELTRIEQETRDLLRPPHRAAPPPSPPIPVARVVAVSSQAAVVLFRGARIKTWPGGHLGPWTVESMFPDGLAIRHKARRVVLPLSFTPADAR